MSANGQSSSEEELPLDQNWLKRQVSNSDSNSNDSKNSLDVVMLDQFVSTENPGNSVFESLLKETEQEDNKKDKKVQKEGNVQKRLKQQKIEREQIVNRRCGFKGEEESTDDLPGQNENVQDVPKMDQESQKSAVVNKSQLCEEIAKEFIKTAPFGNITCLPSSIVGNIPTIKFGKFDDQTKSQRSVSLVPPDQIDTWIDRIIVTSASLTTYGRNVGRTFMPSLDKPTLPGMGVSQLKERDKSSKFLEYLRENSDGAQVPLQNDKRTCRIGSERLDMDDIRTVTETNWLNDKAINGYMQLLVEENYRKNKAQIYALSPCIVTLWNRGVFDSSTLIKEVKFNKFSWIFLPININENHWILLAVDIKQQTVHVFDSLGREHPELVKLWSTFVKKRNESLKDEEKPDLLPVEWKMKIGDTMTSGKQTDGSSCGAFVLLNALAITMNVDPNCLGQEHADAMRKFALAAIMKYVSNPSTPDE